MFTCVHLTDIHICNNTLIYKCNCLTVIKFFSRCSAVCKKSGSTWKLKMMKGNLTPIHPCVRIVNFPANLKRL